MLKLLGRPLHPLQVLGRPLHPRARFADRGDLRSVAYARTAVEKNASRAMAGGEWAARASAMGRRTPPNPAAWR